MHLKHFLCSARISQRGHVGFPTYKDAWPHSPCPTEEQGAELPSSFPSARPALRSCPGHATGARTWASALGTAVPSSCKAGSRGHLLLPEPTHQLHSPSPFSFYSFTPTSRCPAGPGDTGSQPTKRTLQAWVAALFAVAAHLRQCLGPRPWPHS